ncbi:7205_t:CDS:10 [Ambispora leptoticha]|uniref:7205_t:CDS:1 n=1 Tax=Ambispora leptoticha TaxID=144679 RepID=A0A9N8VQS0_9GLOM|nr:7205_t:CDS:10 [Ambispora leptoticha]
MSAVSRIAQTLRYFATAFFCYVLEVATSCWRTLRYKLRNARTPADQLRSDLWHAKTYKEWAAKAHKLDLLLGNDAWKEDPKSPYYDSELIKSRLDHLKQVRMNNDVTDMIYLLRSGLLRNLGGLNDPKLFERSYLGTKKLIEDYTQEVVRQLEYIGDTNFNDLQPRSKIDFYYETRQSFGCTALVLYGGATFGLYHLGVCKALNEHGLLPRIISGTAIGALIAALVCIHTDDELPSVFKPDGIDLGAFSKVGQKGNIQRKISRFLKHGYLMDVKVLEECVRSNVEDLTFEEAFARTNRILNITVSSARKFEVPQLLNYLTAPNVLIRSAALASAAMMGLYSSVELLAKDKTGAIVPWAPTDVKWKKWTDAVPSESESPFQRITELFNVNHFIVSQANPYIVPFMPQEPMSRTANILYKCGHFISSEFRHRILQLEHMRLIPKILRGMVDDKVSGNVTIVPHLAFKDFKELFSNPTAGSLDYWIQKGEQSTWPVLALIRNRCMIELALDRTYIKVKAAASSERVVQHEPNDARERNGPRKRTKSMH